MKLTFEDALRIANGCTDYGRGYRDNQEHYEIYQDGIQTVIAALEMAEVKALRAEIERLRSALNDVANVPPDTVSTAAQMRRIAKNAIATEERK